MKKINRKVEGKEGRQGKVRKARLRQVGEEYKQGRRESDRLRKKKRKINRKVEIKE